MASASDKIEKTTSLENEKTRETSPIVKALAKHLEKWPETITSRRIKENLQELDF